MISDCLGRVAGGVPAAVVAAIGVGGGDGVHPRRPGFQRVGVVGHRRRDGVGGIRPAVIGLGHRDDVVAAGGRHGQAQRQVVGLRTGVDQEHRVQRVGQGGGQSLGERDHAAVVEPRVGVEAAPLARGRVGQHRMAVAEDGDVVDHVQIAAPVGGQHVLAPAAFDAGRVVVVVLLDGGERVRTAAPQLLAVVGRRRCRLQAEQRAGIGDQAQPARRVLRRDEVGHRRIGLAAPLHPHVPLG